MEGGISIHLAPLALFHIGTFPVTNTLVTTITVSLLLVLFAWLAGRNLKLIPGKFQSVVELLVMYPYEFTRDTLQNDAVTKRIFPVIMTIFLLVLLQNWFGLLPITEGVGIAPATPGGEVTSYFYSGATDLNFTFSLALIAFLAIEFFGVTTMGFFTYAKKFLNFQSPIKFVVGLIELVSEFARLISYSFRLFGNVFAGKVLILVIGFFVPLFLPVPFLAFETFVGFIQAAIFALLTLFFTKIAIEIHDEAHSEEHASLAMSEALEEGLHHAEA
ncbi:MAG TPA: F0F1 ATP synthase subunit A [Candidatus Paceibacterota bacterium]|nr:F0F1 ATP synthase subunit A [Candidatus Paceibacterota bacterium]